MAIKRIVLEMPEEDWVEIYYALVSKQTRVLKGKYGEEDSMRWAEELKRIEDYVAGRLDEEGVPY